MALVFVTALVVTALAAAFDYRTGRIPNALVLAAAATGLLENILLARSASMLLWVIEGAFVCGLVPLVLWRFGVLGGGDVKLFAALGVLLLPALGIEVELMSFLIASVFLLIRLSWRRSIAGWFRLGPAILAGTAVTLITRWP